MVDAENYYIDLADIFTNPPTTKVSSSIFVYRRSDFKSWANLENQKYFLYNIMSDTTPQTPFSISHVKVIVAVPSDELNKMDRVIRPEPESLVSDEGFFFNLN